MGGQSFGCPYCDKWFLDRHSMRAHLKGAHNVQCNRIDGTGQLKEEDLINRYPMFAAIFIPYRNFEIAYRVKVGDVVLQEVHPEGRKRRMVYRIGLAIGLDGVE